MTMRFCREVAQRALVTALEVEERETRRRHVAFEALHLVYPEVSPVVIGAATGYAKPDCARDMVERSKLYKWWNEYNVDHVIGSLVAEQYGERAL